MNLADQMKLAAHIQRLVKVPQVIFPIANTYKGTLAIRFTQDEDDFEVLLDSVPLSTKNILNDENNIELKDILEKYLFHPVNTTIAYLATLDGKIVSYEEGDRPTAEIASKKRGRPKKNA